MPICCKYKDYDEDTSIELDSRNRRVFDVRESPETDEFVLIGVTPGKTCMEVHVSGNFEECIDVQIITPLTVY